MMATKTEEKVDQGCDPKGTAFNREAGFPCRRCGTPVQPQFTGNTLVCYYCPTCDQEIEP